MLTKIVSGRKFFSMSAAGKVPSAFGLQKSHQIYNGHEGIEQYLKQMDVQ